MYEIHVLRPDALRGPTAVVMLIGWLGAQDKVLKKYAEMWVAGGVCTVRGTAPTGALMLGGQGTLRAFGLLLLERAGTLLSSCPSGTSLVVHCFSNGGAFVYEALQRMAAGPARPGAEAASLALLRNRLKAEIFDSAPCALRPETGLRAISLSVPHAVPRLLLQALFLLRISLQSCLCDDRPRQFWVHWLDAAPVDQLYVYGPRDQLCPVADLEALVEARRALSAGQASVTTLRFEDSAHVSHFRAHPAEYARACLEKCGLQAPSAAFGPSHES